MKDQLLAGRKKLSLIGLGYVGMPVAVAFARKVPVIGFDISKEKISQYKDGIDPTREVGDEVIKTTSVEFTSDETRLHNASFHIIAVPTPVHPDHTPDLFPIKEASRILSRNLTRGSIVVFESTVYPGVTEEICVPILERGSRMTCGVDFFVGYSPERINPGDKIHRLETITKIVAGMDQKTCDTIAQVYELVVEAGVYKASSIKVAEAAKVIENSQRDINIAFMNELSIIFNKMGISTKEVLEAASTKWNFLKFSPGLVGGHCIGVDPYYLTYKAEQLGYHSQIILAGRRINDGIGKHVAEHVVKTLIAAGSQVKGAKVAVLGFTFKENCPDTRNTRVIDIITELREYGIEAEVCDPVADEREAQDLYGITFVPLEQVTEVDALVVAVSHKVFSQMGIHEIDRLFKTVPNNQKVVVDVKSIFDRNWIMEAGYRYWSL